MPQRRDKHPHAEEVRLQAFLAHSGVASRRAAEELIASGRVFVNGVSVTAPGTKVRPGVDAIEVEGQPVEVQPVTWIALHKPRGYVTSREDQYGRRTVYDLIPERYHGLFHVGRLDRDSEGLLLLTNDGELANRMLHPSFGVTKEYWADVEGKPTAEALHRLVEGVEDEGQTMRAESVRRLHQTAENEHRLSVVMQEGKKREVRRMLEVVGHRVRRLIRRRFGPVALGELKPGKWRVVPEAELAAVRAGRPVAKRPAEGGHSAAAAASGGERRPQRAGSGARRLGKREREALREGAELPGLRIPGARGKRPERSGAAERGRDERGGKPASRGGRPASGGPQRGRPGERSARPAGGPARGAGTRDPRREEYAAEERVRGRAGGGARGPRKSGQGSQRASSSRPSGDTPRGEARAPRDEAPRRGAPGRPGRGEAERRPRGAPAGGGTTPRGGARGAGEERPARPPRARDDQRPARLREEEQGPSYPVTHGRRERAEAAERGRGGGAKPGAGRSKPGPRRRNDGDEPRGGGSGKGPPRGAGRGSSGPVRGDDDRGGRRPGSGPGGKPGGRAGGGRAGGRPGGRPGGSGGKGGPRGGGRGGARGR